MSESKKRPHCAVDVHSSPESPDSKRVTVQFEHSNMADFNIQQVIETINKKLDDLAGTKDIVQDMKSMLEDLVIKSNLNEEKCNQALSELKECKQECQLLRKQVVGLEKRVVYAESYSRGSNLIFDGISQTPGEDIESKVRQVLMVNMNVDNVQNIQFVRVHRLKNTNKTIVRFEHFKDKDRVWSLRRNLKGSKI